MYTCIFNINQYIIDHIVSNTNTYFIYSIGFCQNEPTGIKITTKSTKSIHVTWDTTNINCGYTITGYRVYFNSISPTQVYKHMDVTGSSKDNRDIYPIIPGFTYSIYVKALTVNGEISNPTSINYTHPHASKLSHVLDIKCNAVYISNKYTNQSKLDVC